LQYLLEWYGHELVATQVFFIEIDDAEVCQYDVVRPFNYLEGSKVANHLLSWGEVLFHFAWQLID